MLHKHLFTLGLASLFSMIAWGSAPAEAMVQFSFGSHPQSLSKSIRVHPSQGLMISKQFGHIPHHPRHRYHRGQIRSIPFHSLNTHRSSRHSFRRSRSQAFSAGDHRSQHRSHLHH